MRVKIKNGNNIGKTLNAHTLIAFKHDFEHVAGSSIKIKHIANKNSTLILFDFKMLIIYNIIIKVGGI